MTETEKILAKLIAFPTVSHDSNLALIEYVQSYLGRYGIESQLTHNDEGTKTNLYAVIGPGETGGVMLSGHTDVVPVEGQNWAKAPFEMVLEDGKFYGRGTTDMKGFIASVLAMVPASVNRKLKHPIHLAFSYDEEIGCVGVRRMIDMLESATQKPSMCIIGEPTSLKVGIAHKGKTGVICRCHGMEAHSALAENGLNAIYLATEMISSIGTLQQQIKQNHEQDTGFTVPYSTLHVGTIHGGTALNIVPGLCEFKFEIRNLKSDDPNKILEKIKDIAKSIEQKYIRDFPSVSIEIEIFNEYPALNTSTEEEVVRYIQALVQGNSSIKLDFGTEGGLFQNRLGVPTVVCGPGSMDQGHKPDEFIEQIELQRCDQFLSRLLDHISI